MYQITQSLGCPLFLKGKLPLERIRAFRFSSFSSLTFFNSQSKLCLPQRICRGSARAQLLASQKGALGPWFPDVSHVRATSPLPQPSNSRVIIDSGLSITLLSLHLNVLFKEQHVHPSLTQNSIITWQSKRDTRMYPARLPVHVDELHFYPLMQIHMIECVCTHVYSAVSE